jgi:hypothetical protein
MTRDDEEAFLGRIAREAWELLGFAADEEVFQEALDEIIHAAPQLRQQHLLRIVVGQ